MAAETKGTSRFINGMALMIQLSIRSRMHDPQAPDRALEPESDGATVFEIEHDIAEASGYHPPNGAVWSSIATLERNGFVVFESVDLGAHDRTKVFFLTDSGVERVSWFMKTINSVSAYRPRDQRGPRVSGGKPGRPHGTTNGTRRRRRRRGNANGNGS